MDVQTRPQQQENILLPAFDLNPVVCDLSFLSRPWSKSMRLAPDYALSEEFGFSRFPVVCISHDCCLCFFCGVMISPFLQKNTKRASLFIVQFLISQFNPFCSIVNTWFQAQSFVQMRRRSLKVIKRGDHARAPQDKPEHRSIPLLRLASP